MSASATLICPKCRGEMRTYERNGVLIDQCEECRGIFLDRGELDQLIDLERGKDGGGGRRSHDDEPRPDQDHENRGRGRRRTGPTSLIADLFGGGE
jgi:Zn-finger nucleic acid-binding protein